MRYVYGVVMISLLVSCSTNWKKDGESHWINTETGEIVRRMTQDEMCKAYPELRSCRDDEIKTKQSVRSGQRQVSLPYDQYGVKEKYGPSGPDGGSSGGVGAGAPSGNSGSSAGSGSGNSGDNSGGDNGNSGSSGSSGGDSGSSVGSSDDGGVSAASVAPDPNNDEPSEPDPGGTHGHGRGGKGHGGGSGGGCR